MIKGWYIKMIKGRFILVIVIILIRVYIREMNKQTKFQITDEEVWFIIINQETRGPLSLRDLDVLLRTNDINSRTFAWKQGMAEWKVLNDIEEMKASILESSKEILQIQRKRQHLFDKIPQKKQNEGENVEDPNNQIIENKDENALTILQSTVENLVKKTFHQSTDGKWNVYDEEKGQWVQQDEEPVQKIEKMKQLLFNKLKNELFFDDKNKRKKNVHGNEENKQPELPLTEEQLIKREKNKKKARRQAEKKKEKWYISKKNTFIYISGLPLDITEEELKQFVNKAGVLRVDLLSGKQKLKLYRDENGALKGDAAVSYVKEESVQIAIQLLSNKEIRSGFKINIQKAQFNQKLQDYKPRETKKQNLAKKIQEKMLKKKQFSWDQEIDEQGDGLKIVIMKHMFDFQQSDNDEYMESVKNDITEELSKIGEILRIRFYESHPDGVIQVKFKNEKSAETCIHTMNGRFFDQKQIECDYWDGQTDFKKDASSLLLQQERLSKYGEQIQGKQENVVLERVQELGEQQNEQQINNHLLQDN